MQDEKSFSRCHMGYSELQGSERIKRPKWIANYNKSCNQKHPTIVDNTYPRFKIVTFIACGNINNVTEDQRKQLYEGGCTLFDVRTGKPIVKSWFNYLSSQMKTLLRHF